MLRRDAIRALVNEHGVVGYLQVQKALLEGEEAPNGTTRKMRPEDFSIRALWEGLVGPLEDTIDMPGRMGWVERDGHLTEDLTSTGFSSAIGQLISARLIDSYNSAGPFIGDELVDIMPSRTRGERLVGFTTQQGPKPVGEAAPYEDSTFTDKYVGTRETKRGRLLSVTREAVVFDQTGQILLQASRLGDMARQERERRIIRAVIDADSGEAVYQPNGTAEQLYAAGNNNLDTGTGALADWTDIQSVLTFHATNVTDDRETDDTLGAQPIAWMPKILLVGTELAGTAARIVAATEVRDSSGAIQITGNPLRMLGLGGLRVLSSPFIDNATDGDQFDDASDWYIGDFKKQFVYKEVWPLQVTRAPANNEEQFTRDIMARFKVSEYGDVIATDERWVVKVDAV